MRAVVFKSHHEQTAGHATVIRSLVPDIEVYGGVVLNRYMGGLNADAVEACAALGGKIVWLPTFTAAHHLRAHGEAAERGVTVLGQAGRLSATALDVLDAVAARGMALSTGHISPQETALVVPEALRRGVRAVVVTHPDAPFVGVPVELQRQLARLDGVFFERCFNTTLGEPAQPGAPGAAPLPVHGGIEQTVAEIRAVGTATTILSSDLGQPENPFPTDGLRTYFVQLLKQGVSEGELHQMSQVNPAIVLGLA